MWLRDQRVSRVSVGGFVRDDQHVDTSLTGVHPYEVAGDYDAQLAGLRHLHRGTHAPVVNGSENSMGYCKLPEEGAALAELAGPDQQTRAPASGRHGEVRG